MKQEVKIIILYITCLDRIHVIYMIRQPVTTNNEYMLRLDLHCMFVFKIWNFCGD